MNQKGLDLPVQYLKGIGPKRASILEKLNIYNVRDLLYYLPSHYEDRRNKKRIYEIKNDEFVSIEGTILQIKEIKTRRFPIIEAVITDKTGFLRAKWFNQSYLSRVLKEKTKIKIFGKVKFDFNTFEVHNPDFEILDSQTENDYKTEILPVYKITEGLSQKQFRNFIESAINYGEYYLEEFIPESVLKNVNLPDLKESILKLHRPDQNMDIELLNERQTPYHKRVIFEELLLLQLGILLIKRARLMEKSIQIISNKRLVKKFIDNLPFKLTKAQLRVVDEILTDMEKPFPMNRLLQGDVGSGKTVVALIAMLAAVESGNQSALMAPTELLAEQHYFNILSLLKGMNILPILHTSTHNKHTNLISSGDAQIIIGTHALIQEDIRFKSLGLVVIDEQHRFGVLQRALLRKKGLNPHTLVMTATPIPRTLALTVYGDLDYSVIDELPANRKTIQTEIINTENNPENKKKVYKIISDEIKSGGQVYVVYPLIEESEALDLKSANLGYQALQRIFPQYKVGIVHGKMPSKLRDEVMREFRKGDIKILVATTVIEVGVDVPNATLMIITHAERFGLAQLHQLRGRVGRGSRSSRCILLPYKVTADAELRLRAMVSSNDGFKIAEEDLKIRGPGEFFGTKQSGIPDLKYVNFVRDRDLFQFARNEGERLLDQDPQLKNHISLKNALEEFWKNKIDNFTIA